MTESDEKIIAALRAAQHVVASDLDFVKARLAEHAELLENHAEIWEKWAGYVDALNDRMKKLEDSLRFKQ